MHSDEPIDREEAEAFLARHEFLVGDAMTQMIETGRAEITVGDITATVEYPKASER